MITGGKNYFRIVFGGSTGKPCNSPGGYYIQRILGNYFLSAVIAPFVPVSIFGEIFRRERERERERERDTEFLDFRVRQSQPLASGEVVVREKMLCGFLCNCGNVWVRPKLRIASLSVPHKRPVTTTVVALQMRKQDVSDKIGRN